MKYVQHRETQVGLKEKLIHQEIIQLNPNAHEVDTILFDELMNMINGDLAIIRYIAQNVKRSGLEIWRRLNRHNDPNTYGTKETLKRQIEQLASNRSKDIKELSENMQS